MDPSSTDQDRFDPQLQRFCHWFCCVIILVGSPGALKRVLAQLRCIILTTLAHKHTQNNVWILQANLLIS